MPEPCFPEDDAAVIGEHLPGGRGLRWTATPELVAPQSYLIGYGSATVEALTPGIIAPVPGAG
jgi:hypothetical protein